MLPEIEENIVDENNPSIGNNEQLESIANINMTIRK